MNTSTMNNELQACNGAAHIYGNPAKLSAEARAALEQMTRLHENEAARAERIASAILSNAIARGWTQGLKRTERRPICERWLLNLPVRRTGVEYEFGYWSPARPGPRWLDHATYWTTEDRARRVVIAQPYDLGTQSVIHLGELAAAGCSIDISGASPWMPGSTVLVRVTGPERQRTAVKAERRS